jgi:hypothetical protein
MSTLSLLVPLMGIPDLSVRVQMCRYATTKWL